MLGIGNAVGMLGIAGKPCNGGTAMTPGKLGICGGTKHPPDDASNGGGGGTWRFWQAACFCRRSFYYTLFRKMPHVLWLLGHVPALWVSAIAQQP